MMKKSFWLMVGLSMAHLLAGQAQTVTSNAALTQCPKGARF